MTERATRRELLARYLARYLRQRAELGQRELYLESSTNAELLEGLRAPASRDMAPEPGVARVEAPAVREVVHREVPGSADRFEELRVDALGCTLCRRDRDADLLVVGEAPGYEEDRQGRPFVGPAGKLLDKMLAAIGFRRDEVFICNVLKCRPPQNRDPVADEVAACWPYLRKQVEFVAPKAICAFGRFAAQTLLATEGSLGRLRGATHEFMGIPVVVTYHPAALLRNQQWKRPAWEDLKVLRRIYDEAGGRTPGGSRG